MARWEDKNFKDSWGSNPNPQKFLADRASFFTVHFFSSKKVVRERRQYCCCPDNMS